MGTGHELRATGRRVVHRTYAKGNPRLESAFAAVSRERFLGPGPWQIMRNGRYVLTPDADPIIVYDDVLIGIVPERGLNKGIPSYHPQVLASADIRKGEPVVHVGGRHGLLHSYHGTSGRLVEQCDSHRI